MIETTFPRTQVIYVPIYRTNLQSAHVYIIKKSFYHSWNKVEGLYLFNKYLLSTHYMQMLLSISDKMINEHRVLPALRELG